MGRNVFFIVLVAFLAYGAYRLGSTPTQTRVPEVISEDAPTERAPEPAVATPVGATQPNVITRTEAPVATPRATPLPETREVALKIIDRELLKKVSGYAWMSTPGFLEPKLGKAFDRRVLAQSKAGDLSWSRRRELRSGVYAGVLDIDGGNIVSYPFWIRLEAGAPGQPPTPYWLRWSMNEDVGEKLSLDFKSPYAQAEIYKDSLHLPSAPFQRRGIPMAGGSCEEILLVKYMQTALDTKTTDTISFKAFCRRDREEVIPLGQMAFSYEPEANP